MSLSATTPLPTHLGTIAWRDPGPDGAAHGIYFDLRDEPWIPLRTFDTKVVDGVDVAAPMRLFPYDSNAPALAEFQAALGASGLLDTQPSSSGNPGLAAPGEVVVAVLESGSGAQRNYRAPLASAPAPLADALRAAQQLKATLERDIR